MNVGLSQNENNKKNHRPVEGGKKGFHWALALAAIVCSSIYPVWLRWAQNADKVSSYEVWRLCLTTTAVATIIWALLSLFTRDVNKGALVVILISQGFFFYGMFEKMFLRFFPAASYWHVIAALFYLLFLLGAFFIRPISKDISYIMLQLVCFTFLILNLYNLVGIMPAKLASFSRKSDVAEKGVVYQNNKKLPNIYYLIFDEACGFESVRTMYGVDPTDIILNLEKLGFTISENSHNESIVTTIITANLMNLSYDNSITLGYEIAGNIRKKSVFFETLRNAGYKIYAVGPESGWYGLVSELPDYDTTEKTITGETFSYLFWKGTALRPFTQINSSKASQAILKQLNFFTGNLRTSYGAGNLFFSHFLLPHQPFLFDKNGQLINVKNFDNWKNPEYYRGQYLFTLDYIIAIAKAITFNDPDSIIIIQSDHSARLNLDPANGFLTTIPFSDITNILNCVYFRGEPIPEMEGQSGVNTLRLILNRAIGTEFELLPFPQDLADVEEDYFYMNSSSGVVSNAND